MNGGIGGNFTVDKRLCFLERIIFFIRKLQTQLRQTQLRIEMNPPPDIIKYEEDFNLHIKIGRIELRNF